ncbi:MAG: AAA family ATPase [Anaerolineaceae bacterium]|nr:AAA family ATPase [Anaerolineaceae bacterium]
MYTNKLLIHPDVHDHAERHNLGQKLNWTLLQLALNGGSSLVVKGTAGYEVKWRRTPLQGNHYYLWWFPENGTIYARDVRLHDQTSSPLHLCKNEPYIEKWVDDIDPREAEQVQVSQEFTNFVHGHNLSVCTVQGAPGCGKTIAIQYAIQDLWQKNGNGLIETGNIWYVTYTPGLAEKAGEFFDAHVFNEGYVEVFTLHQLKNKILGRVAPRTHLASARAEFEAFCRGINTPAKLGRWKNHVDLLWMEIRAYILGMALPLEWQRDGLNYPIPPCQGGIIDEQVYIDIRRQTFRESPMLDETDMRRAWELAHEAKAAGLFPDQQMAYEALKMLLKQPDRLPEAKHLKAVVVDEVQDFTLLEMALLTQLGKLVVGQKQPSPFSFLAAGDESQILHPSGFDWGITKNFFKATLRGKAATVGQNGATKAVAIARQRRCPKRLAELIQRSWELYRTFGIPKEVRPQVGSQMEIDPDEAGGNEALLGRCRLKDDAWRDFFREITEKYPDAAFIDLDDSFSTVIDRLLGKKLRRTATPLLYNPQQIKGLDRKIIFLWGLDRVMQAIVEQRNGYGLQPHQSNLLALEARRIVDMVRVALSRSTHTLIVLEQIDAPDYLCLGLNEVDRFDVAELLAELAAVHFVPDKLERIHCHWRNAEELLTHERLGDAEVSVAEAQKLLGDMDDEASRIQQKRLEERIFRAKTKQAIEALLASGEAHLEQQDLEAARESNEQAQDLLSTLMAGADLRDLKEQIGRQEKQIVKEEGGEDPNDRILDVFRDVRNRGELWDRALWFAGTSTDIRNNGYIVMFASDLLYLASRYQAMPREVFYRTVLRFHARWLMEYTEMYMDFLEETHTTEKEKVRMFAEESLDQIWKSVYYGEAEPYGTLNERLDKAVGHMKEWNGVSRGELW